MEDWASDRDVRAVTYSGGEWIVSHRDSAQSQERRIAEGHFMSTCSRTCLEFHILRQTCRLLLLKTVLCLVNDAVDLGSSSCSAPHLPWSWFVQLTLLPVPHYPRHSQTAALSPLLLCLESPVSLPCHSAEACPPRELLKHPLSF